MSVRDSEISVRASAVELLDTIRKTGLLEPDDIDNVGRLIFDTEPRVRKAVAGFFAENINDLFESTIEDFGGEEGLAEVLGEEIDTEYDTPRTSWLKLKCVAEALQSYDAEEEDGVLYEGGGSLVATGTDSRYALAAQNVYDGIPEVREWEFLAGYLLYDFSSEDQGGEEADADFKSRCKLNEKEEILLLEILNIAVKSRLSEALERENDKRGKRTKAQREEAKEMQETAAMHLARLIPRLLKKFGSNSTTATAVLRLEHVLNLEIFQELRQDSTAYASLLDDINRQFLSHADQGVLAEASTALLHAREFDDLEEVTEDKLGDLWDDTINTLRTLITGGISDNVSDLCHTVRRIANLASISDCVDNFDRKTRVPTEQTSSNASTMEPRHLFVELVRDPALDAEAGEEADELLISAMKSLLFYYMWAAHALQSAIALKENLKAPAEYSTFSQGLVSVIATRHKLSSVRIAAIGTLLDLHTLFATFRHTPSQTASIDVISSLIQYISNSAEDLILSTFTALEKAYAKKSRKTLEPSPDEDLDSEPEGSSDEEDDEDDSLAQQQTLLAEKQLCELAGKMVLAIVGRVLDHEGPNKGRIRERLLRNKGRLGSNFKEVIAYLDGPKAKGKRKPAAKRGGKKVNTPAEVRADEDESENEPQYEEGGDQDLRERELVEDRIVDPDEESTGGGGGGEEAGAGADEVEEDDDPMGD